MEATCENNSDTIRSLVFELPGEPAVVINGVPDIPPSSVEKNTKGKLGCAAESSRNTGFGDWLEGREVRKLFDGKSYSGAVTEFDKETGWYRVVYEDGDFEDLEWHELQDVLQPLDIAVPLKSLALKIIRKSEKSESGTRRSGIGERKRGGGAKAAGRMRTRGSSARS
ncbi:hypothetical protein vseg_013604 [Gypsophila vaccaria]